ncbi:MAG: hypothetical protein FD131_3099 [Rhodocyclaceae bacterium]|nr:MAG: hypothetical protein FD131_3099 [Rhodocyclaceae bacterium]
MSNLLMRNNFPNLIIQNINIISHINCQDRMRNSKIGILNNHNPQGLSRNPQLS